MQTLGTGAHDINFRVAGDRDPTFLFVHGFGCALTDWDRQVEALSPHFRCVALDLPGHGATPKAQAPILPALAAAVNVVREQAGSRQVILVGHSLGTKVVREAYRQSPDGVVGLVFVDGSLNIGDAQAQRTKARQAVRSVGYPAFATGMFREMFVEGSDPALVDRVAARAATVDPQYAEDLYVEAGAWDSVHGLEQLRQVQVPTLVLQSSYYNLDLRRVPLKEGMTTPLMEAVAREIPGAEIKVIEGVGHFTMLEAPEAVNRELATFARRITNGADETPG